MWQNKHTFDLFIKFGVCCRQTERGEISQLHPLVLRPVSKWMALEVFGLVVFAAFEQQHIDLLDSFRTKSCDDKSNWRIATQSNVSVVHVWEKAHNRQS